MELPTSDRGRKEVVDGYSTEKMLSHAARIRDERGFDAFPIIDADAHHYESESNLEIAEYIDDNAYMRIYSLIEETGKPLAFHSGFNANDQFMAAGDPFIVMHALGFTLFNVLHICNWICNGMNERFPKLKVVWTKSGLAWMPWVAQRLDSDYRMRSSECPMLTKLPSEYIQDMYYTTQPMKVPNDLSLLESTFKVIKAETQLLFGSDYPHWDMELPSVIWDLPFLDEAAKRNILGGNARKVYNIDVSDRYPDNRPMAA